MEYISAASASEKWGVSLRQVQRLLSQKRIPLAKKYGRSWMIPENAEKPIDLRKEKEKDKNTFYEDLLYVIDCTTIPMPCSNPDSVLNLVEERRLKLIYEGELAYLRGDFAKSMDCYYKTVSDNAARLRSCPIAIAAAISLGDYNAYKEIDAYLNQHIDKDIGGKAIAELVRATAAVSMLAPNMTPQCIREGDLSCFPVKSKPNALYIRAKYLHCTGQLDAMLAVAQTVFELSTVKGYMSTTDIYLRITCAVACHALEREAEAREWLLSAMRLALPHGIINPFAEAITSLGGLVEKCLECEFPHLYNTVLNQWKLIWKNWTSFHNKFTNDNITLILSLREYHIAALVARRVPYSKIASKYGISVGRLKNIIMEIHEKLFVSNRKELSKYIIWH